MNKVNRYFAIFILSLLVFFVILFSVMSMMIKASVRDAFENMWVMSSTQNSETTTTVTSPVTTLANVSTDVSTAPVMGFVDVPIGIPEPIEFDYNLMLEPEAVEAPEIEVETEVEETVEYFDVPLDHGLQDHIFALCEEYDVDPAIIVAMIERESVYDARAIGDGGDSHGLMQIQPQWHEERMHELGCTNLLDPYQNVTVGIDFFSEMLERGDVYWALMAYNGGESYANYCVEEGVLTDYALDIVARSESLTMVG